MRLAFFLLKNKADSVRIKGEYNMKRNAGKVRKAALAGVLTFVMAVSPICSGGTAVTAVDDPDYTGALSENISAEQGTGNQSADSAVSSYKADALSDQKVSVTAENEDEVNTESDSYSQEGDDSRSQDFSSLDPEDPEAIKHTDAYRQSMSGSNAGLLARKATTSAMKTPYTSTRIRNAAKFKGYSIEYGIDVSNWQGNINWKSVKRHGVKFAIIRVGYRGVESGGLRNDSMYVKNIEGALKAGIKVGAYIYSQATTPGEARAEADFLVKRVKKYKISMPLVLDYEFYTSTSGRLAKAHLTKRQGTNVCSAFCQTVTKAGYTPMVYGNIDMFSNHLYAEELAEKYPIWLANFSSGKTFATAYDGTYTMWQYTSTGKVRGISGNTDVNIWYKKEKQTGATKLNITDDQVVVASGNDQYLYYSVNRVDDVKWTSSNPAVAYVKDGTVYGVSRGETTITASTTSGASDSCRVAVTENMNDYEILGLADQIYTGSSLEPSVRVRSKQKQAVRGVLKSAVGIYTGPGDTYSLSARGKKGMKLDITAMTGKYYAVSFTSGGNTKYGYVRKKYVTADTAYRELVPGQDYVLKYTDNVNAGTALVEAVTSNINRFTGTVSGTFKISPAPITSAKIVDISDQVSLDQTAQVKPEPRLYFGGGFLTGTEAPSGTQTAGVDYTYTYSGSTLASGKGEIVLEGHGNFTGTASETFRITGDSSFTVEPVPDQIYTGSPLNPGIVVKDKTGQVISSDAYQVTPDGYNTDTGTGRLSVTCNGQTRLVTFAITGADIAGAQGGITTTQVYNKKLQTPDPALTFAGAALKNGTDYVMTYSDNCAAGTATAVVHGTGNFRGTKTLTFDIGARDISPVTTGATGTRAYAAGPVTPSPAVFDSDVTLIRGADYNISYRSNQKRGRAYMVITGTGNYTGSRTVSFQIGKKKIGSCSISAVGVKKHTGKRIRPAVKIYNSGHRLKKGRDYSVNYGSNRSRGRGTITVKGKGNYSGTKKIYFRIY